MGRIRYYVVNASGDPIRMNGKTMTFGNGEGKYVPPTNNEILALPRFFGLLRRRMVVYPHQSPLAYPLGSGTFALNPRALSAQDAEFLYGDFWPTLLARALKLVAKMQIKDWVVIGLLLLNASLTSIAIWLAYKIAKYARLI